MNQIPSVDLRDFLSDNEQTKSMFVQTIGKAFQEIGFCAVRGHFLDDDLVNRLYSQIKLFFDLPTDIKRKYEHPEFSGQRGQVSFGKESAKGSKHGDLKEYWHFGQYISEKEISNYNFLRSLTFLSAKLISELQTKLKKKIDFWVFSGGGIRNLTLMHEIKNLIGSENIFLSDELGYNSSFIESSAFGYISVRTLKKLPSAFPSTTGCKKRNICGEIYYP